MSDPPGKASRRQSLGQYFTPATVVDFALDALAWLSREDPVGPLYRTVIDPACGDGAFLQGAIGKGLVAGCRAFGLDNDPALRDVWREGGLAAEAGPRVDVSDGLLTESICGTPVEEGSFDWAIGNPPYAGRGLKEADEGHLQQILERYELCHLRYQSRALEPQDIRRLPIEVLFIERFYRLCRPEGLIAIILPVGILANERWRFVREWLLPRATLYAVVGLPRDTFRAGGIAAKTCLVIARKSPVPCNHEVLLAEVEQIGLKEEADELPEVLRMWMKGGEAAKPDRPWTLRTPA